MSGDCSHHGPHAHSHIHPAQSTTDHIRQLTLILVLVAGYCILEVVGGIWSGSLALLADAGHMVSDTASIGISLFAMWMLRRRPSQQQTFGFYRAEIIAALVNGALLFVVAGAVLHEAWERFQEPHKILSGPMLWIAIGGLLVNVTCLWILHGGKDANLNMRGAWLHILGDTLGSVAVIIAALMIWAFQWIWADPVASILMCLLILRSAWHLASDAASILMEHAPRDIDVNEVRSELLALPDVVDVHCLHIWTIATGFRAVSAHVVLSIESDRRNQLQRMQELLSHRFDLKHITLQLEDEDASCCEVRGDGVCLLSSTPEEKLRLYRGDHDCSE